MMRVLQQKLEAIEDDSVKEVIEIYLQLLIFIMLWFIPTPEAWNKFILIDRHVLALKDVQAVVGIWKLAFDTWINVFLLNL